MDIDRLYALGLEIKLIVCDLDGTLLDERKQISDASLRAIERAREVGITTTICTGRTPSMLQVYSRNLDIQAPLIAANGGVIFDTRTDKVLYKKTIAPDVASPLLSFCQQNKMDYAVLAAKSSFFPRNSVRIKRIEQYNHIAQSEGLQPISLRFFDYGHSAALSDTIYKILIYEQEEGQQKFAEEYLRKIPELIYTSSEKGLLDISAGGVSKGNGLSKLARLLGIEERHICVFGDYYNDISMMEKAGFPIAMGNAPDDVKQAALAVTDSNEENGVALGIEKYILQAKECKNENP